MSEASKGYFLFLAAIFLILSAFVLYVVFIYPFYVFLTLFVEKQRNAWCIIVFLGVFVVLTSCFIAFITKEREVNGESVEM